LLNGAASTRAVGAEIGGGSIAAVRRNPDTGQPRRSLSSLHTVRLSAGQGQFDQACAITRRAAPGGSVRPLGRARPEAAAGGEGLDEPYQQRGHRRDPPKGGSLSTGQQPISTQSSARLRRVGSGSRSRGVGQQAMVLWCWPRNSTTRRRTRKIFDGTLLGAHGGQFTLGGIVPSVPGNRATNSLVHRVWITLWTVPRPSESRQGGVPA
jgi:hypothetical protein